MAAENGVRELQEANRRLDGRAAERTQELEQALGEVNRATTAAASFLSNLNHEMRTPLNGILGMLELLETHAVNDATRSYIAAATESGHRLHRLLVRMLDLVELRNGHIEVNRTETTLATIAEQTLAEWRVPALTQQKLLTLSTVGDEHAVICIDVPRTIQILHELIGNAVTHADPGVVEVHLDTTTSRTLAGTVVDAGPGFDPPSEPAASITRADHSTERTAEGAGLGLGLASMIANVLGGRLAVTSAPGSGTTAHFHLPMD